MKALDQASTPAWLKRLRAERKYREQLATLEAIDQPNMIEPGPPRSPPFWWAKEGDQDGTLRPSLPLGHDFYR